MTLYCTLKLGKRWVTKVGYECELQTSIKLYTYKQSFQLSLLKTCLQLKRGQTMILIYRVIEELKKRETRVCAAQSNCDSLRVLSL